MMVNVCVCMYAYMEKCCTILWLNRGSIIMAVKHLHVTVCLSNNYPFFLQQMFNISSWMITGLTLDAE